MGTEKKNKGGKGAGKEKGDMYGIVSRSSQREDRW